MQTQSENEVEHFKVGDVVRVIGKPQLLKIIDSRQGMPHIHIEAEKKMHYKCEWRRGDGVSYSAWYEESKLERAW